MQLLDAESIRKAIKDSVFDVVFVHQVHRLIVVEKEDDLAKEYPFDKINIAQAICEAKRVCGSLGIKPYKI